MKLKEMITNVRLDILKTNTEWKTVIYFPKYLKIIIKTAYEIDPQNIINFPY